MKKVVRDNFDEIVNDDSKDVLIGVCHCTLAFPVLGRCLSHSIPSAHSPTHPLLHSLARSLAEFYDPSCGPCKTLRPKYKKLAKKLAKVDDVVVAAMDAVANDVPPEYKVTAYPVVFLALRGDKGNPMKYELKHEVDDMLEFLRSKSSAKIPKFKVRGRGGAMAPRRSSTHSHPSHTHSLTLFPWIVLAEEDQGQEQREC